MKKLLLVVIACLAQHVSAQEADIKKSIQTFFDGLHTADTLKIQTVCREGMLLQSVTETAAGNRFVTESMADFYKSIASIPEGMKIEERLLDYKIQVDGPLAHAWTPYEFYVNGKMTHSGINSFQLYNEGGTWKIIYIADTRRVKKQ